MTLFQKKIWIASLFLFLFVAVSAHPVLSKTSTAASKAKNPQASQHAQKPRDDSKTSQPGQPSQGSQNPLHCEDAQSAVLMDALTGQVLYEQNSEQRIPPASFVKVMTLYLVYDAIRAGQMKMDDMVTVSENAWKRGYKTDGSKMFLKVGDRVKVEDLIKGVAIASGNDACVVLAEHLSGAEETFVAKMNEKAKVLGLKNSQFRNPDGLPADGQYVSALDMANLSRRYIEDYPQALVIHSATEFEYNGIKQGNRNTLLYKNIGVDGLKTGHIAESGYHLVATAKREGQRMIAVVMGCQKVKNRGPEAQKLLEYGFKNYITVEPVKRGALFGPVKVKRGKTDQVILTAAEDVRVTVARGKESTVSVVSELPKSVVAPIQKGQVLAKIPVQLEGKLIKEINLIASVDVQKTWIPPWPVLVGILFGLCVLGLVGFFWLRRSKPKKY
jgi:D-alanyl-D-alanine carboxypeptidase (penicillin-binding protein 5/6)